MKLASIDKRFESVEKQIANLGTFMTAVLAGIIALIGYVIWDRKNAFEKAFSEAIKKMEQLFKTHIDEYHTSETVAHQEKDSSTEPVKAPSAHQKNEDFSIPKNIQEKFRDIVNFMNQFPEMRNMQVA